MKEFTFFKKRYNKLQSSNCLLGYDQIPYKINDKVSPNNHFRLLAIYFRN